MGTMISEAEYYGKLAQENPSAWEQLIHSGQEPLFVRNEVPPPDADKIGPTLNEEGKILRDMGCMECAYFERVANPEQRKLYDELLEVNVQAAIQYMLTISGLVDIWKRDMELLREGLDFFKWEESDLERAEIKVQNGELREYAVTFPLVLKRHFPHFFADFVINGSSPAEVMQRIRETLEDKVKREERVISNYLEIAQQNMPYLFK